MRKQKLANQGMQKERPLIPMICQQTYCERLEWHYESGRFQTEEVEVLGFVQ
jgi:hypothetical protein